MVELPFVVVHGAWIWKVLLVVIVALVYATIWGIRVVRARRAGRAAVAERNRVATAPVAGSSTTIVGTLRGGTLTTLEHGKPLNAATGSPYVECDGTRVALPDDVLVVEGRRDRGSWRVPRESPHLLRERAESSRTTESSVLRELVDGDRVTLAGTLAARPPSDEAGYRDAEISWTAHQPATIAATAPRRRANAIHPLVAFAVIGVVTLATYKGMVELGDYALEDPLVDWESTEGFTVDQFASSRFRWAFAMPGSRDDAAYQLDRLVEDRRERTSRGLAFAEAVHAWRGRPCDVSLDVRDLRFERAATRASACGDHERAAYALALGGHYERAIQYPGAPFSIEMAIALGDWRRAARLAEAAATARAGKPVESYEQSWWKPRDVKRLQCMAGLFRHHAREPVGVLPTDDFLCEIVAILLRPPAERRDAYIAADAVEHPRDAGLSLLLSELRHVDGFGEPHAYRSMAEPDDVFTSYWRSPWLARFDTGAPVGKLTIAMLDDPRTVIAKLDTVPEKERSHREHSIRLAVALRTGTSLPAGEEYEHPAIARVARIRRRQEPDRIFVLPDACKQVTLDALVAAYGGDGLPLARAIHACRYTSGVYELLFGALPLVTRHRRELAETVSFVRDDIGALDFDFPFSVVGPVAAARDLHRIAGDEETAAALHAIYQRHTAAFSDRDRTIALSLWVEKH